MHTFNLQAHEMAATMEHQLRTEQAAHFARLGFVPEPPFWPIARLRSLFRRIPTLAGRGSEPASVRVRPRACTPPTTGGRRCANCGDPLVRRAALARPGRPSRCMLRRRRPQLERRW